MNRMWEVGVAGLLQSGPEDGKEQQGISHSWSALLGSPFPSWGLLRPECFCRPRASSTNTTAGALMAE